MKVTFGIIVIVLIALGAGFLIKLWTAPTVEPPPVIPPPGGEAGGPPSITPPPGGETGGPPPPSPRAQEWQLIGPGGGGRVRVWFDHKNANILYALISPGGVRKTTNNGLTWEVKNQGLNYEKYGGHSADAVQELAIHPQNTDVLLMSASAISYTASPLRIYRSTDGAESWQEVLALPIERAVAAEAIAFDSANPNIVYAAALNDIYKSENLGAAGSWRKINETSFSGQIIALAVRPDKPQTIFAATDNSGVFISENGGRTWSPRNGQNNELPLFINDLLLNAQSPATLYAATAARKSRTAGAIYKTTDAGLSWIKKTSGLDQVVGEGDLKTSDYIEIEIDSSGVLYTGDHRDNGRIFRSINGGESWVALTNSSNVQTGWQEKDVAVVSLAVAKTKPGRVYFSGQPSVILKTETALAGPASISWRTVTTKELRPNYWQTTGADGIAPYAITVDPKNSSRLYLGYGDSGVWRSDDGGKSFMRLSDLSGVQDISNIVIDNRDPSIVYVTTGFRPGGGTDEGQAKVLRCTSFGESCRIIGGRKGPETQTGGLPSNDMDALVIDPTDPKRIYAVVYKNGVYRAYEVGDWRWEKISGPIQFQTKESGGLAIHPTNSSILYVTAEDEVWKTMNAKDESPDWVLVGKVPLGNRGLSRAIHHLAIDPVSPSILYAAASDGLYKSKDGGATWTEVTKNLGIRNVRKVIVNPRNSNIVYFGARGFGVFKSDGAGEPGTWGNINYNIGSPEIVGLALDLQNNILIAGVKGAGAWLIQQ